MQAQRTSHTATLAKTNAACCCCCKRYPLVAILTMGSGLRGLLDKTCAPLLAAVVAEAAAGVDVVC